MAFADAFSADNVSKLMNDPRMMLGLQLMAQGRQGSSSQALGQAGSQAAQLLQQHQHSQQLQQYRQAQIQQAEEQRAFQMQQAQAKQDAEKRQRQALADPTLQQQLGPMARQLASLGMPLEDILRANSGDALQQHRAAQLRQQATQFAQSQANRGSGGSQTYQPKAPTPRQVLEEPLDGGMIQKHVFDPATGGYKPYGKPYRQFAPGKADPMQDLLGELTPDDNAGPGQAVPGLPGSNASTAPAPQGAALLMHGSGANPVRAPATPTTKAEYDALPTGAAYVDPATGKTAIKKARG